MSILIDKQCRQCSKVFQGGPRAWYCPECRHQRHLESMKQYYKCGAVRPFGSIDHCSICGAEYVVTAAAQKYCRECSKEAVRQAGNANMRQRYKRSEQKTLTEKRCAICGELFPYDGRRVICENPECKQIRKSQQRRASYARLHGKPPIDGYIPKKNQ